MVQLYCLTLHPIRQLSQTIREYCTGHFNRSMIHLPFQEYSKLIKSIEDLATFSQNANSYQKDFVANGIP